MFFFFDLLAIPGSVAFPMIGVASGRADSDLAIRPLPSLKTRFVSFLVAFVVAKLVVTWSAKFRTCSVVVIGGTLDTYSVTEGGH